MYAFYKFWGWSFFTTGWLNYFKSTGTAIGMFFMMKLLKPYNLEIYYEALK